MRKNRTLSLIKGFCILFVLIVPVKIAKADTIKSEPNEVFNGYDIYACSNSGNC